MIYGLAIGAILWVIGFFAGYLLRDMTDYRNLH